MENKGLLNVVSGEFWDTVRKGEGDFVDLQRVGRILRELSELAGR